MPRECNVRVEATSRNPANKYDRSVMDLNAFDVLLLVLAGLLLPLGVLRGLARLPIGAWALVAALIVAAQFHWQVAASMLRVVEMPEPVCEGAA